MSTVVPPQAQTSPPAQPAALPRATVIQAPPPLAELPPGAKIDVVIAEILAANEIKVSSNLGDITLKLPGQIQVKVGDALIVQLLGAGRTPRVQLAGADGKPLTLTPLIAGGQSGTAATQAGAVQNEPVKLTAGGIVTASLLRPITLNAGQVLLQASGVPAPAQSLTPQGQAGTQSQISGNPSGGITGNAASNPAGNPAGNSAGNLTGGPTGTPATLQPGSGQLAPAAQGTTTVPAGSALTVKIITVTLPQTTSVSLIPPPPQGPISLAPGALINGIVSGHQGIGQTIVETHAGPIALPTTAPLPLGTALQFEIVSLKPLTAGSAAHGLMQAQSAPLLDGEWLTFDEALGVLRDVAPGAHSHLLQTAMPRADSQLASNVLFFLSALRGGELKNWMGDGPLRILERQRPELAARLRTDIGQMTRNFEDPLSGEWRLQAVPFLHGADIDRLLLLVRDQEDNDDEDDEKGGGTRFVVDLNLSRLGHLQIDGLVGNDNKRLDLVLRSDTPLEGTMRDDIRGLYADALELTGLEGSVGFQAAPGNFVEIPKGPASKSTAGSGVVI